MVQLSKMTKLIMFDSLLQEIFICNKCKNGLVCGLMQMSERDKKSGAGGEQASGGSEPAVEVGKELDHLR